MKIKQTMSSTRVAFFLFAAVAFIGLGIYSMGYTLAGVIIFASAVAGLMLALAILKNSIMIQMSIERKRKKRK
ncbi:MAG TPA: hypothetical protein VJY42_04545 [Candidatus Methanomethylophilaceae archaeon]|nr:hypothetical protein [Candidatus Methanomethylophilaceae archaeon]